MTTEYSKQDKEFDTATGELQLRLVWMSAYLKLTIFFTLHSPPIGEKLDAWTKELTKADAVLLRKREELYKPLWEKRDEIINKIDGFWPQAVSSKHSHLRCLSLLRSSQCLVCSPSYVVRFPP